MSEALITRSDGTNKPLQLTEGVILATKQKTSKRNAGVSQKKPILNMCEINPMNNAQENFFDAFNSGKNVVGAGSAGTGKSYISLYLALKEVISGRKQKIIIVRNTVPSREVGFLPGTHEEKIAIYEMPYEDIVNDLCDTGIAYEILKKNDKIQFMSSSFIRGMTFDDAIIIIDEFQNFTKHEIYGVLTRVGKNTQVIVIGDTKQNDLSSTKKEISCFSWVMNLVERMHQDFDIVEFLPDDIVRSGFVKRLIVAAESM